MNANTTSILAIHLLTLGVLAAAVSTGLGQPVINVRPISQSVSLGANVTFQVTASGGPLGYQWRFNALDLLEATNRTLNLTNVQVANAGDYAVVVTNSTGSVTSSVAHLEIDTTFTKITSGAIVQDLGVYAGCAWGDFNNDGFLDLLVCNWQDRTNVFYRNNGDGTFTKIIQGNPVQDANYHVFAAWGDYDNDGNLDLFVGSGGGAPNARHTQLWQNKSDGTFSGPSGGSLTNQLGFFGACAWADYDNDGFLDLFVEGDSNGRNLLFHNHGDGTFTKVAAGTVTNDIGAGWGALWADYDSDGFMDLLVVNTGNNVVNFLYHNNRNGAFTRVLTNVVATDRFGGGSQGAAWGDYDNDGRLDLFVTDLTGRTNRLYHNDGDGNFSKVSWPFATASGAEAHGCSWGDYDNDGYLDLFVNYGGGKNTLYHNNGDGTFTQILSGSPANDGGPGLAGNAVSWVDYDNDGFLDLFLTKNDANGPTAANLLYRNNGNSNAWLEVNCVGTVANRSAVGTKVRVRAAIGRKTVWQLREVKGAGGLDAIPLVAHFGLGEAINVDLLRIEWPSGIVQTLTNVAPRQILTVVEHQSGTPAPPKFTSISRLNDGSVNLSVTGESGLFHVFEASTDLANWTWLGARSNATGNAQFTDSRATNYPSRFYRVSVP